MNKYRQDIIDTTLALLQIPSITSTPKPNQPFGEEIDRCLEETLEQCNQLGMSTYKDPNGYYGYAQIGDHPEYIGILCHLDVVPTGDPAMWDTPPFDPTIRGDQIIGRGAGDDKGPTVSAIYAVKAILDEKVALKRSIRLIFGTDEETLWRGIDRYKAEQDQPFCAFAADGYFPFTYAEKGLLQMDLTKQIEKDDIIFSGGSTYNSVADKSIYKGSLTSSMNSLIGDEIEAAIDEDILHIIGTPSHAASPHIGKNAVLYMAQLLRQVGNESNTIKLLTDVFNYDYSKTALFDTPIEDHTGPITINIGALSMDESVHIKLDCRFPVTYNKEDLISKVKDKVKLYGFDVSEHSYLPPLYVPLDSPFTKILLDVYQSHSNDFFSKPRINGGATYARAYPDRAVCYGVKREGRPSFAHEPNERIDIDVLVEGAAIYKDALIELLKLNHI